MRACAAKLSAKLGRERSAMRMRTKAYVDVEPCQGLGCVASEERDRRRCRGNCIRLDVRAFSSPVV
jgi:hypothetical protein